jgi:16S rRNA (adenine1518-N6/adenine1519-N6)-dimethyltransferase
MTLTEIKAALESKGFRPLKRFGQNFLHDQNLARWLVDIALAGKPEATRVVEIGPGLGAITEYLLQRGVPLTALEVDKGLAESLRERLGHYPHFTLLVGDALVLDLGTAAEARVVVGNLPYYISTPLLARWMSLPRPPERMVFTLQREVCARLAAKPRTKEYGALTVGTQVEYEVELLKVLPPEVFYPRPEVDSGVVRLEQRTHHPFQQAGEAAAFRAWVRKGFSQRRKKVGKILGILEDRRAEELSVAEWLALWQQTSKRLSVGQ